MMVRKPKWRRAWEQTMGIGMDGAQTWLEAAYVEPTPTQVATLVKTHGWSACKERWGYLRIGTLERLNAEGKALLNQTA